MSKIAELKAGQVVRRVVPRVTFPRGEASRDLVVEVSRLGVVLRGKYTGRKLIVGWGAIASAAALPSDATVAAVDDPIGWLLERRDEK